MNPTDPQFIYMVFLLPSLFGLTLMGEGVVKIMHAQLVGIVSIVAGMGFIGVVGAAYFYLQGIF
jgi:hypothetical protein